MAILVDLLVFASALAAALYCHVLARRVARLADMRGGVGGAIAALSERVDALTRTLDEASAQADHENAERAALVDRAERVAMRLEIMLAALQDVENGAETPGRADQSERSAGAGVWPDDPDRNEGVAKDGRAVPSGKARAPGSGDEAGRRKCGSMPMSRTTGSDSLMSEHATRPVAAGRGSTLRATRHPPSLSASEPAPLGTPASVKGGGITRRLVLRRRVLRGDTDHVARQPPAADSRGARMEPAE